jgi:hypothetical protein
MLNKSPNFSSPRPVMGEGAGEWGDDLTRTPAALGRPLPDLRLGQEIVINAAGIPTDRRFAGSSPLASGHRRNHASTMIRMARLVSMRFYQQRPQRGLIQRFLNPKSLS